jgi:hypothetical protein
LTWYEQHELAWSTILSCLSNLISICVPNLRHLGFPRFGYSVLVFYLLLQYDSSWILLKYCTLDAKPSINQSINHQSINQSINQSTNQSINQSIIPIWYDYTSLVDQIVILSVFFATTTNSKIAIQYLDWNIFESGAKHNKTEPNQTIQYLITTGTVLDKTSHLLLEHDQYGL